MLDIPHFTEVNNEKGLSNLWGIFGGDPKKREERRAARLERRNAADVPSGEKKEQPTKEEPKPGIWKKIKDALKRKD
jgi:hypothetical protein